MNEARATHPTASALAAFGLGQLSAEEAAAIEPHLASCDRCCDALGLVREDAFVARLRSSAQQDTALGPTLAGAPTPSISGGHPPEPPPALAHHPRYRVLQALGSGGMGTVYKAEHQRMERPVALKVLHHDRTEDAGAVERFQREVKAAARLHHPNIVTAYDADQAGDTHFLVMELVEGTSLDRVVAEEGPLPVPRACDYARQAALGLQHAFERGMVHRDIKPQNLMRTPDGTIKVLDFGLARFARECAPPVAPAPAAVRDGALTQTGTLMGTPDFMAPEQAANAHEADIRADIYSLGCTLYFLLTGRVPFAEVSGLDKVMAHLEQAPPPLTHLRSDVLPGLAAALERMMAKAPAQRYQTPAEVVRALTPFARPAEALAAQAASARGGGRRRLRLLLGGLGGAGLVAGLVLLAQGGPEAARERLVHLYSLCAAVGGALLACQLLLSLLGLGHHHDVGAGGEAVHDVGGHHDVEHDVEHDSQTSWFVGVLTFRTVVAALLFFGLAGRAADAAGLPVGTTLAVALAAGASALFLVAWGMRALYRLRSDGTVRIERAVGRSGSVYLPIPGHKAGLGKVLLNVQNRTVEYQAVTAHQALPTGTPVVVLAVINADTVEVTLATPTERDTHV
jgi:hypothetical protein